MASSQQSLSDPSALPSKDAIDIIIAADELEICYTLQKKLGHIGYSETAIISQGENILSRTHLQTLNLLIVGRYLKDTTCRILVPKLRKLPYGDKNTLPILMVTSSITQEVFLEFLEYGINDVLLHPCSIETLAQKTEALVTSSKP
jgi:DNA-binding response OmpR family regulator